MSTRFHANMEHGVSIGYTWLYIINHDISARFSRGVNTLSSKTNKRRIFILLRQVTACTVGTVARCSQKLRTIPKWSWADGGVAQTQLICRTSSRRSTGLLVMIVRPRLDWA